MVDLLTMYFSCQCDELSTMIVYLECDLDATVNVLSLCALYSVFHPEIRSLIVWWKLMKPNVTDPSHFQFCFLLIIQLISMLNVFFFDLSASEESCNARATPTHKGLSLFLHF